MEFWWPAVQLPRLWTPQLNEQPEQSSLPAQRPGCSGDHLGKISLLSFLPSLLIPHLRVERSTPDGPLPVDRQADGELVGGSQCELAPISRGGHGMTLGKQPKLLSLGFFILKRKHFCHCGVVKTRNQALKCPANTCLANGGCHECMHRPIAHLGK